MATIYLGRATDHVAALKVLRHDVSGAINRPHVPRRGDASSRSSRTTTSRARTNTAKTRASTTSRSSSSSGARSSTCGRRASRAGSRCGSILARRLPRASRTGSRTRTRSRTSCGASLHAHPPRRQPVQRLPHVRRPVKLFDFGLAKSIGTPRGELRGHRQRQAPVPVTEQIMQLGITTAPTSSCSARRSTR